jgi:hypothetical protein
MSSQAESLLQVIAFFQVREAMRTGRAPSIHVPHLPAPGMERPSQKARPVLPQVPAPAPRKGNAHPETGDRGGYTQF